MDYLIFALRVGLGVLLVAAGVLKAHDGAALTANSIAGYRLLPAVMVAPLGVALPYLEIFLGAYLVAGLLTGVAAWIACAQFVTFAAAVASLVVRHIAADCGCFGSAVATPPTWSHVAADLALAATAAAGALRAPGALALDRRLDPSGAFARRREA